MKRLRLFVNFEKEEQYLTDMAQKGWEMTKYSWFGFYTFKKSTPKERHYRIDYRTFKSRENYADYVSLLDEAGWRQVSGNYHSGYRFFLPKSEQAESLGLFSDENSLQQRIRDLSKNAAYSFLLTMVYTFIFWGNSAQYPTILDRLNPQNWYLTPGLWEKNGLHFVYSFLFETPFALLRGLPPFILLALALIQGIWAFRAYKQRRAETA